VRARNVFSAGAFSLRLCTFTQRYGFETPLQAAVLEAFAKIEFEINSLVRQDVVA